MDTTLQVRIGVDLKERLQAIEIKHGISMSELTRRALSEMAEKMEKTKTPLPARD